MTGRCFMHFQYGLNYVTFDFANKVVGGRSISHSWPIRDYYRIWSWTSCFLELSKLPWNEMSTYFILYHSLFLYIFLNSSLGVYWSGGSPGSSNFLKKEGVNWGGGTSHQCFHSRIFYLRLVWFWSLELFRVCSRTFYLEVGVAWAIFFMFSFHIWGYLS